MNLSVPVLKKGVDADGLVRLLTEAADRRNPADDAGKRGVCRQAQYRQHIRSVELFGKYLKEQGTGAVNPDEKTIDGFLKYLVAADDLHREKYWRELSGNIRLLINALPEDIRNRQMLTPRDIETAGKFDHLTKPSQLLLKGFLEDGKKASLRNGSYSFNGNTCTAATRENAVSAVLVVLRDLDLNDLTKLTDRNVDRFRKIYASRKLEDRSLHYLNDIKSLYRYLLARKAIRKDPLCEVPGKPVRTAKDFLPRKGIAPLRDLSTVNMRDFIDVRGRTLCLCMYDFCLRVGEATLLLTRDFSTVDGFVELTLRPEVQKGQNRQMQWLYNFLPETLVMVRRYLEIRSELRPESDSMFISDGLKRGIAKGTCQRLIKEHMESQGIKSDLGKTVHSHLFRHGFASGNWGDIGLCLSDDAIRDRLRHSKRDLLNVCYKTVTRDIAFDQHRERMRMIRERQLSRTGSADVASLSMSPSSDNTMPEGNAMDVLKHFGFTSAGLRKAAGALMKCDKQNGVFLYSRSWVSELASNWITKQKAMEITGMTQPQYWHWTNLQKIETTVIGMVSIVKAADACRMANGSGSKASKSPGALGVFSGALGKHLSGLAQRTQR